MWFLADVIGLLLANVVSFSSNGGPGDRIFSANLVPKTGCNRFLRFMLSGRYTYGQLPVPGAHGHIRLSDDYVVMATEDVTIQLSKAGVRLASMLNKAFGQRP